MDIIKDKQKSIENMLVTTNKEEKNSFDFSENKFIFYCGLFYAVGLFIGAYFYKIAQSDKLNELVIIKDNTFSNLMFSNFCAYYSLFLITAFLGFCLISAPLINIVPIFIGIATGSRLSYYFVNYDAKGVGYSLIMIVPYIALLITTIAYTMKVSVELSTKIRSLVKGDSKEPFEINPYLKKYLILAIAIAAVSVIDSGLTKLLFSVVTI